MRTKKKKATKVAEKPLAPQVEQLASFDMTVITAVPSDDDVVDQQNADISIVPYTEDEEALEPPQDKSRIEELTKYSSNCRSCAFSALEFTVKVVLLLLACVFLVVLIKSGKAYGKW
eukprot:scaffold7214_cov152-Skeletonema_menzelii.AAC.6